MIAIIVVAIRIIQRHTATHLTSVVLERDQERLDGRSGGPAGVAQKRAEAGAAEISGCLAYDMLAVGVPAV